ncbi:CECR1.2 family protein [Megaselia abdita]
MMLLKVLFCIAVSFGVVSSRMVSSVVHSSEIGGPTVIMEDSKSRISSGEYNKLRSALFKHEQKRSFGSSIELNEREKKANEILMAAKNEELTIGFETPYKFNPSRHFFESFDNISSSNLFKMIEMMPKGAVLHAHDTALCSTDFLISLTYWDDLWMCYDEKMDQMAFRFSKKQPTKMPDFPENMNCKWRKVPDERKSKGAKLFDEDLRKRMSLYPVQQFRDINHVWQVFMGIFATIDGLLMYVPGWEAYYYNALKEFRADNVNYFEFRTTLPILYDLEGTKYTEMDTAAIYQKTYQRFKKDYPDFIGSKLIYAPLRNVDNQTISKYIELAIELKAQYPDFFAGFDLVGQEDLGRPLIEFVDQLLSMPKDINFYFHAGETNWNGQSTDENLLDAVLLGTKRIGHGYALYKHPSVLDVIKERNIAIEVNPISNQVLLLVADTRNHPCSYLFANDYPVVISSDDPSFWKAKPLSHDFYIAFLGIANSHADLRLLKQLALNSLTYSAMNSAERELALIQWRAKWDDFIEKIIKNKNFKKVLNSLGNKMKNPGPLPID